MTAPDAGRSHDCGLTEQEQSSIMANARTPDVGRGLGERIAAVLAGAIEDRLRAVSGPRSDGHDWLTFASFRADHWPAEVERIAAALAPLVQAEVAAAEGAQSDDSAGRTNCDCSNPYPDVHDYYCPLRPGAATGSPDSHEWLGTDR